MRKVASADHRSIFYRACAKFRHAIHKQNESSGLSSNGASFVGVKKIATTLICYTRLTEDSRNALNRSRTGKNPFLKFIRPDFWTDLNGCRQRLLFACQLTQRKCSLCSQGTYSHLLRRGSTVTVCIPQLIILCNFRSHRYIAP